ncbi:MAG: hypothetical protein KGO53_07575 [Alphaproteobacteria bacterium]|nr:hypothetical protein [Alphaproteobacteria bacterium]
MLKSTSLSFLGLAVAATAAHADCAAEVKSMAAAITAAGPLRYAITDNSSGKPMAITMELVPATAMRFAWEGGEQVFTLSGGWIKVGGAWQPAPQGAVDESQAELKAPWWAQPEKLANLKCLGAQSFAGKKLPAYSFDVEAFLCARALQHLTLYKGKNNLPVAMQVLKQGQSSSGALAARIIFDKTIKIAPPQ